MDRTEVEASLRILSAVARADGKIDGTEARALAALSGNDDTIPNDDVDIEREAARIRSAVARRVTFDAAVALASVDGHCAPEEHALLERLWRALDISAELDLQVTEDAWRERLRAPRAEYAAADVDFLHQITNAESEGTLSPDRYVTLVAELRSRRTNIFREALGSVIPS